MGLFKEAPYKEATQNIIDVIGGNYKVFDTACTCLLYTSDAADER